MERGNKRLGHIKTRRTARRKPIKQRMQPPALSREHLDMAAAATAARPRPAGGGRSPAPATPAVQRSSKRTFQAASRVLGTLLEAAPTGIAVIDRAGIVILWNQSAERIFGWKAQEVLGQPLPIVPPEHTSEFERAMADLLRGDAFQRELRRVRKDGTVVDVHLSAAPLRDGRGKIWGAFGIFTDISERKRAEGESSHMASFPLLNPNPVLEINASGEIVFSNRAATEAADRLGVAGVEAFLPPDMADVLRELAQHESGSCYREVTIQDVTFGESLYSPPGLNTIRIYATDITERKRAEQALRERVKEMNCLYAIAGVTEKEDSLEKILQGSADVMPAGWFYPESACARITLEGRQFQTGNFRATDWRQSAALKVKGQPAGMIELCYLEERPIRDEGPFLREERNLINAIAERLGIVTARKRAEEALRESEMNYRELAESIGDIFFAMDSNLKYMYWNNASEAVTRISASDALGKSLYDIFPDIKGTAQEALYLQVLTTHQAGIVAAEYRLSGEPRFFEISAYPSRRGLSVFARDVTARKQAEEALRKSEARIRSLFDHQVAGMVITSPEHGWLDVNDTWCRMIGYSREELAHRNWADQTHPEDLAADLAQFNRLLSGEIDRYSLEKRFIRKDGTVLFAEISVGCVRRPDGSADYIVGLATDITERKRAEEALQQSALELQEKNAELERFLYTASHDLKSPVVTVRTFLGYLEQDLAAADAGRIEKDARFIRAAVDKMGRSLDELLEISRIGRVVSPPVRVALRSLVDDALSAVAGRIAERGVTVKVDDQGGALHGDRLRLAEVWQNLVENACKFMGDQKEPRIEIGVEARGAETVFFVRDNGIGLDPHYHTKVFDLFEKLDPNAEGTGLGLALVKRIVELYQGRIWVESSGQGQGACFYFTLPGAVNDPKEGKKL